MINYDHSVEFINTEKSFRDSVREISKFDDNTEFYIGATCNVHNRWIQHIKEKGICIMFVICHNIPTKNETKLLEQKLIKKFKSKCLNQTGGGEGIIDAINCIYILFPVQSYVGHSNYDYSKYLTNNDKKKIIQLYNLVYQLNDSICLKEFGTEIGIMYVLYDNIIENICLKDFINICINTITNKNRTCKCKKNYFK